MGMMHLTDEEIIGYEALWDSMIKCKSGVLWKDSVAQFFLNGVNEVRKLSEELENGTYKERPHHYFKVTSPKERDIMSISFRDRVYQRSLNDVAIYPEMTKHFIYDNGACQRGRGTDFARNRMKCHLQRFFRKHGLDGYVLKMDIKSYYATMRHDVAKATFAKYLDPNICERADAILDGFPGEMGFNPGSQIIQIAGISVLNDVDHYAKEQLRIKHYIRYMDDTIIIGESKEQLRGWLNALAEKLAEIGFTLHPRKTKITPIKDGFMFLGFEYRLTKTGKIIMTVDPKRVSAERRKLFRMARLVKEGKMSEEKIRQCYGSWREHASHGNSWHMLQKMDSYFENLMEGS